MTRAQRVAAQPHAQPHAKRAASSETSLGTYKRRRASQLAVLMVSTVVLTVAETVNTPASTFAAGTLSEKQGPVAGGRRRARVPVPESVGAARDEAFNGAPAPRCSMPMCSRLSLECNFATSRAAVQKDAHLQASRQT